MPNAAAREIRFGIRLPNSGPLADPGAVFSLARKSEQAGFDSVWVHDHLTWAADRVSHYSTGAIEACSNQEPIFFESVTTAAAVGAVLDHATVGIAGLALPLRDPRLLAKQLSSLDTLLGGNRLVVAFGIGSQPEDFRVMGVPWKRRGRITNAYLEAVRVILHSTETVDFESEEVSFQRATFQPAGRGVVLLVAASSAAGLARAARLRDGWLCGAVPVERYASAAADWRTAVDEAGRDPDSVTTAFEAFACVKPKREQAIDSAAASLIQLYGSLADGLDRAVVGDPDACIERLAQLVELGAQSFELRLIGRSIGELEGMVDLIAENVLPAFGRTDAARSLARTTD